MANKLNTPLKRMAWLAAIVVCLLMPVLAVAHDHDHDPHSPDDATTAVEQCLFCQAQVGKSGPLPPHSIEMSAPLTPVICTRSFADGFSPATDIDPTVSVRGPPGS